MEKIIRFSVKNKLIIFLMMMAITGGGLYSLIHLPVGSVPDITNNQVQVLTTSRNLSTQDVEKYLTYPVELEMANLPNVKEIRSISKFGLSVVTIVFDDEIGTFVPRQLIEEKLKMAEEKIPAGFGKPFMGPITTGLGEIYQYTLEVDPAYRSQYSVTDLRTIQDWIVKRKLSGISGVVEVNTWGGYLKQYEVSVDPYRLNALGISMTDIYEALQKNNSIAGGGYIEKGEQTYFIRGEGLVESLEDIENITVRLMDGIPLLMKDVATVRIGHANRFGAITGNGEGEKVMGQVMMLKGANSKDVINAVNEKVSEINQHLPAGVHINAFLERSELINKTTFTIVENLILGFIIVMLVVMLLLGNWRSGLVVASVIPFTLLFALSAMYIFKIDANLLSLGAIDFGIIIDGAVIIVEYIAFKVSTSIVRSKGKNGQDQIDELTISSTVKMMKSAVFGQLIIMIVFIPILSLSGIEGKMFGPMAMVFCFAIIGAMLLCFTYVPVISSLLIRPKKSDKRTLSERLMEFVYRGYRPILLLSIRAKLIFIGGGVAFLLFAVWQFGRMGGEFVPTLDEGDIVIQPVLKTGTSLSETIEITTKIEKELLKFPEVDQVVSRIGAAEVPTDPMSMEEGDVMIKLKPKSEWKTADSKDELVDKMKTALQVIPGVDYEFTQPIEMRFNELITGVRADLAIKVFGEDLDQLYKLALQIEGAIKDVPGASDVIVEKTAGLPQMIVKYDDKQLAKYGVDAADLNELLTMGFAGVSAGTVFEGEKQFDLVVKLDTQFRKDLNDIKQLPVVLKDGNILPLSELAEIDYAEGPAKISRDNTNRRIVVGVNVRGRDLASVVADIQTIVNQEIKLPDGYYIEYGGQFENLASAKQRLLIAVPVSLVLIFIMLYFAFKSFKEALVIFTAIPFAAVGGVFLLALRDMPFSISAGVGFIALFGIAVLNGIVLIEEFKELKEHGYTNPLRVVLTGTKVRLRPVLLTAGAAALGFLPMAISTNAGAEVQRPLATVVIGGLISSTLLTLVILPNLFLMLQKKKREVNFQGSNKSLMIVLMVGGLGWGASTHAQTNIGLEEAFKIARENNLVIKSKEAAVSASKIAEGTSFELDKTDVYYGFDQNNIAPNNLPLHVLGASQSIKMPGYYQAKKKALVAAKNTSEQELLMAELALEKQVSQTFYQVLYEKAQAMRLTTQDSLYQRLLSYVEKGNELGEFSGVMVENVQMEYTLIQFEQKSNQAAMIKAETAFNSLLQADQDYQVSDVEFKQLPLMLQDSLYSAYFNFRSAQLKEQEEWNEYERKMYHPDVNLGIFNGVNKGVAPNSYFGMQMGLSINLQPGMTKKQVEMKEIKLEEQTYLVQAERIQFNQQVKALKAEQEALLSVLNYLNQEDEMIYSKALEKAFKSLEIGDIDIFQFTQMISKSNDLQSKYLEVLNNYNQVVIELNYLTL